MMEAERKKMEEKRYGEGGKGGDEGEKVEGEVERGRWR